MLTGDLNVIDVQWIIQYRIEERAQMAARARAEIDRLRGLLRMMEREELSPAEHVAELGSELATYHDDREFAQCQSMGELTTLQISRMLGVE